MCFLLDRKQIATEYYFCNVTQWKGLSAEAPLKRFTELSEQSAAGEPNNANSRAALNVSNDKAGGSDVSRHVQQREPQACTPNARDMHVKCVAKFELNL